ncbi:MAG: hypothetical protein J3R72DRAFT_182322 [Linnemannia gamsii]|nr:MAG: hypothetical protein J3R72DRAFT_182322 [Linnemannia gamsii]
MGYGVDIQLPQFQVPVTNVLVGGSYTSSYVELAGGRTKIKVLEDPKNIVSPCLQAQVNNGSTVALDDSKFDQYTNIDVGFRINAHPAQTKDVWIPMSVEVSPLLRVEYIMAVSLFFDKGQSALVTYEMIKGTYNNLSIDMKNIPDNKKKRIGWVRYDFSRKSWTLRNSAFTRGIITDAGGIPFPLNGDGVNDNASISPSDFKILVSNADILIDQTEFTKDMLSNTTSIAYWRQLAGFTGVDNPRVLDNKHVYTLDATVNTVGISDYLYRMPSRPDLLLRDMIHVQYPLYDPNYTLRFLNKNFVYGTGPELVLGSDNCGLALVPYNSGDITTSQPHPEFHGDDIGPPALIGGGIYGAGGDSQGGDASGSGGSKTKNIVIAVVSVAAVLGAAFAFAFYKWSRRAKEDRFIELEEEMNNEIPLN